MPPGRSISAKGKGRSLRHGPLVDPAIEAKLQLAMLDEVEVKVLPSCVPRPFMAR
jgi:hypothetical protein